MGLEYNPSVFDATPTMRQCPDCKRVYYDERLNFCLDDGQELLHGPSSDEPVTAILLEQRAIAAGAEAAGDRATARHDSVQIAPPGGVSDNQGSKGASAGAAKLHESVPANLLHTSPAIKMRLLLFVSGIVIIVVTGFFAYRYFATADANKISSIAVMPFVNETANADVEYLSDGISETLINSLTELPDLSVKPRSSAFRYKGRESEARKIGSELGVSAIITGRLTQRGDDIRLFVALVDTASENQIWGQHYQRKLSNLVSLQTEIALDVSERLRTRLTGAGEQRARKYYSTDPDAYRLYLQGRYHWNKRSRRDMELAIDYFKQSTARDPRFAPSFAGLADALTVIGGYTGAPARETIDEARNAATISLSLDPNSSESHIALGTIFFYYDYKFAEAEREFALAAELDPRSGHAQHMLGLLFISIGRQEEGLARYRFALELEPVSLPFNRGYALALTYARKFDESVVQFRKTIELEPSFGLAYFGFAHTLSLQGKFEECVDAYAKGLEVSGAGEPAVYLRRSFATGGWKAFLRALLDREGTPAPHFVRALYLIQLDDKKAALDELDQSYNKREGFITLLKVHPGLDPLRESQRFQELVIKVGL